MHWNSWSAKPTSPHMEQTVIVVSMASGVVEFGFTHLHEEEEGEREKPEEKKGKGKRNEEETVVGGRRSYKIATPGRCQL